MKILAIETSGVIGSVALLTAAPGSGSAAEPIVQRATLEGQRTAQSLIPTIQRLLSEVAWRPAELELICVTSGPGSFTGLRIGVVTAKTLAYATGAALVGVHTLAAIAEGTDWPGGRLWTVLDAQRTQLFASTFVAGRSQPDLPPPATEILSLPQWMARFEAGDYVAGPPLSKLLDKLPPYVTAIDESRWHPTAANVGKLGAQLFERGKTKNPVELVPHYYRKSAAEEKALVNAVESASN